MKLPWLCCLFTSWLTINQTFPNTELFYEQFLRAVWVHESKQHQLENWIKAPSSYRLDFENGYSVQFNSCNSNSYMQHRSMTALVSVSAVLSHPDMCLLHKLQDEYKLLLFNSGRLTSPDNLLSIFEIAVWRLMTTYKLLAVRKLYLIHLLWVMFIQQSPEFNTMSTTLLPPPSDPN